MFHPGTSAEKSVALGRLMCEAPRTDKLLLRFELWQQPPKWTATSVPDMATRAEQPGEPGDDLQLAASDTRWPTRERPQATVYISERRRDPFGFSRVGVRTLGLPSWHRWQRLQYQCIGQPAEDRPRVRSSLSGITDEGCENSGKWCWELTFIN